MTARIALLRLLAVSLPLLALVALAALQLRDGGIYFERWLQDIFIPLEAVAHMQHGDRPHIDFQSPIGVLYIAAHYLPTLILPVSSATIVHANLLAALAVAVLALWTAWDRMPAWLGGLFALYAGLTAMSPRQPGELFNVVTYNASYNRYAWAVAAVLAVVALLPRINFSRAATAVDGVLAALLLFAAFYLKVTYFLAGAGLVLSSLVTTRRRGGLLFAATCLGAWTLLMLGMEATTGLTVPYLQDLQSAASVQRDPIRIVNFLQIATASATGLVAALTIAAFAPARFGPRLGIMAAVLAISAAGVAIGTQNHLALENPLIPAAAIVAALAARRGARSARPADTPPVAAPWQALAAVAALMLLPMAQDSLSVAWTRVAPVSTMPNWLRTTPLAGLRIGLRGPALGAQHPAVPAPALSGPLPDRLDDRIYLDILGDAVDLLRRAAPPGARVLPLAWDNPFPTLTGLPPVRHELLWWDSERTFSAAVAPDPRRLLDGVDAVLIPAITYNFGSTLAMTAFYGPELERAFTTTETSRYWTLLTRRR